MKEKTKLERDIDRFCEVYPSFKYYKNYNKKFCHLIGNLDVCDLEGNYYFTFRIKIYLNKDKYPYSIPRIQEITKHIKRTDENHIDEEGFCCLDIEHILEKESRKGINLTTFYKNKVYPFFTNYIFKKETGDYANGEYAHFFDGVIQYYKEELEIEDFKIITNIIYAVASNSIPNRNELCLCGSELKIKQCHLIKINSLKSLSKSRLISDLINFEKFVNTNYSNHFTSNKKKRFL
ncbi:SEC-C domain-containing protein [Oceanihabitans sp. IOP_32]|uniref:SEC-C metal-binding domain-containing protein n=1 Tax=Oceanihabitans sp. IOP_32 TaxID=2529032 RepID=UPI001293FB80|nr:SEC-C metal-binding domain-containing protein [Oceanihabitans sp. IOP_32]QFZ55845.1 SEC-C domain-containing protein [Oceanihabitans sp. IOP_32]